MLNTKKIWFASDLHLGHKAMILPRGSTPSKFSQPENIGEFTSFRKPGYEERFLDAWDQIVKKDDTIYLLGDLAFARQSYWLGRISEMPGDKILVKGNHDQNRDKWYEKFGFAEVHPFGEYILLKLWLGKNENDEAYYGNVMLTHVPAFVGVGTSYDSRYQPMMARFEKWFNRSSCILNIHGHTHGKAQEKHNTFDATLDVIGEAPIRFDQILDRVFNNITKVANA